MTRAHTFVCAIGLATLGTPAAVNAQQPLDSLLVPGKIVRFQTRALASGWHRGRLATMRVYALSREPTSECLSIAPTPPRHLAGLSLTDADSLMIWIGDGRPPAEAPDAAVTTDWVRVIVRDLPPRFRTCS